MRFIAARKHKFYGIKSSVYCIKRMYCVKNMLSVVTYGVRIHCSKNRNTSGARNPFLETLMFQGENRNNPGFSGGLITLDCTIIIITHTTRPRITQIDFFPTNQVIAIRIGTPYDYFYQSELEVEIRNHNCTVKRKFVQPVSFFFFFLKCYYEKQNEISLWIPLCSF